MMYALLSHEITIEQNWELIFQICKRVNEWGDFMPAVKQAFFLSQKEDSDVVQITAEANDQIWTWQSERIIDKNNRKIQFQRISPIEPIKFMRGTWELVAINDEKSSLILTHEFELKTIDRKKFDFIISSIKNNSKTDLNAIKLRAISTND